MLYVPDLNVKVVRSQEIYPPAAQEDGSHQERAVERYRTIFAVALGSVSQQSVWITCISKSTRPGADAGDVLAI